MIEMALPRGTRRSRTAAISLLALAVAVVAVLVVLPWFTRIDGYRRQVREAGHLLARLEAAAVEQAGPVQDDAAERAGAAAALLLPAPTEAQAAAQLQDLLKAAVGASGAGLTSLQALPATPLKGVVRVGARVHLSADTAALQALLHRLEAGTPLLVIDNLSIGTRRAPGSDRPLDVRFDAAGYTAAGTR